MNKYIDNMRSYTIIYHMNFFFRIIQRNWFHNLSINYNKISAFHSSFTDDYIPELSKTSSIIDYEHYKIDGDKELTLEEYLNEISLPISNLINKKKE